GAGVAADLCSVAYVSTTGGVFGERRAAVDADIKPTGVERGVVQHAGFISIDPDVAPAGSVSTERDAAEDFECSLSRLWNRFADQPSDIHKRINARDPVDRPSSGNGDRVARVGGHPRGVVVSG